MSDISWSYSGKVVLITGASRGIGLATANLFAEAGADVYAVSRTGGGEGLHHDVHALKGDVRQMDDLARAAKLAADVTGRIDICVANAGAVLVEDYATTDPAEWSRVVDVNLVGVMRTWQSALPYISGNGDGGRLIANASGAGIRGEPDLPAYSAAKAGISGLVQALAVEYAPRNITVNAVAPGEIETELNREGREGAARRHGRTGDDLIKELVADHIPARRLGQPAEIAAAIAFLASSEAAFITGQTMLVDGGQLLI